MDKKAKTNAAYTEGTVSIVVNALLFAIKMWASVVSGSIALAADAWHTLSDSLTSIMVVVAAKFSSKKADKDHPFGHGRWEQIAALFMAVILGIIGYDFMKESIMRLQAGEGGGDKAVFGMIALVVTIVSIIVKEAMSQYAFYLGKKYENEAITADGWHHRSDALSSIPVLIGILLTFLLGDKFNLWWIDAVLGIIVSLMLFYATYEILKSTITKFLGEAPSPELIKGIKEELIKNYGSDLHIHHIHLHNYVLQKEITFHIRLKNDITIENGHKTASEIEKILHEKFDMTSTIHLEPLVK